MNILYKALTYNFISTQLHLNQSIRSFPQLDQQDQIRLYQSHLSVFFVFINPVFVWKQRAALFESYSILDHMLTFRFSTLKVDLFVLNLATSPISLQKLFMIPQVLSSSKNVSKEIFRICWVLRARQIKQNSFLWQEIRWY